MKFCRCWPGWILNTLKISNSSSKMSAIPTLFHKKVGNPSQITNIFLHGYLGSHKTFSHLSSYLNKELGQQCIELDLRNHGSSDHAPSMSYHDIAQDVAHFVKQHDFKKINLIGYSMGAKVALEYALNEKHHGSHNAILNKVVSLDNSPMKLNNLGHTFKKYRTTITELNQWIAERFNSTDNQLPKDWKKQIHQYLRNVDGFSENLCLYFLGLFDAENNKVIFRSSEYMLTQKCLDQIDDFDDYSRTKGIDAPTLFVKAQQSDFITKQSWKMIRNTFNRASLENFDCDHISVFSCDPNRLKAVVANHLAE